MTIRELSNQLFSLSVAGYFNGQKVSRHWLYNYIGNMFRRSGCEVLTMEICLPDGRWFFTVNKYADRPDGFDYFIPETREQEAAIKARLMDNYKRGINS